MKLVLFLLNKPMIATGLSANDVIEVITALPSGWVKIIEVAEDDGSPITDISQFTLKEK